MNKFCRIQETEWGQVLLRLEYSAEDDADYPHKLTIEIQHDGVTMLTRASYATQAEAATAMETVDFTNYARKNYPLIGRSQPQTTH